MNPVIEAITSRRSIKKMLPDSEVSKETVESVIVAATWAPNHNMTEPWRFVVITGPERLKLGEAMSAALASSVGASPERLAAERSKPAGAPVIVALISSPKTAPNVIPQEEMVAAGAALQNMLLAAHSLGLGSMVRTGAHAYSDEVRRYMNLAHGESLVALVYLGFAADKPPEGRRSALSGRVEWRG